MSQMMYDVSVKRTLSRPRAGRMPVPILQFATVNIYG